MCSSNLNFYYLARVKFHRRTDANIFLPCFVNNYDALALAILMNQEHQSLTRQYY